jgi:hypothetical protein
LVAKVSDFTRTEVEGGIEHRSKDSVCAANLECELAWAVPELARLLEVEAREGNRLVQRDGDDFIIHRNATLALDWLGAIRQANILQDLLANVRVRARPPKSSIGDGRAQRTDVNLVPHQIE